MDVVNYILSHWDDTVRSNRQDEGKRLGLPHDYFVPSISGMFQEMYYWDSYFTAQGLLLCGRDELVKQTAENMFYLIEQFGYMPNGSHRGLLGRSQPPLLSELVKDLYSRSGDKDWLKTAYRALTKEYDFWISRRMTPTGLARHGYNMENGRISDYAEMIRGRLAGLDLSHYSDEELVENYMSDAESGWDFNPRCDGRQTEFCYVDLNSILYGMEENMALFASELNNGEEDQWKQRAAERKGKMRELLFDGELYRDYNFRRKEHSAIVSCASLYPLWMGVASEEEAASTVSQLYRLEMEHGLAVCEPTEQPVTYQWDHPNGWAPLHYIAVHGLLRYGYKETAKRIAEKYVRAMEKIFRETGTLWEKYNVTDGSIRVKDEYEMPEMLGWTAGVYLDLKHILGEW